ncbi:hypothetical protein Hanom_Chr16g01439261 [Helianthus anomalus]
MLVRLTKQMKFLVYVCSFIKWTNTNELPAERYTNYSLNISLICNPIYTYLPIYLYIYLPT